MRAPASFNPQQRSLAIREHQFRQFLRRLLRSLPHKEPRPEERTARPRKVIDTQSQPPQTVPRAVTITRRLQRISVELFPVPSTLAATALPSQ